ncbi:hypothetical protein D3C73_1241190 [compost metagenome]
MGVVRIRVPKEAISLPYRTVGVGFRSGRTRDNSVARSMITIAEKAKTACHPNELAMKLATGRASMIPSRRPLITLPTTRPRCSSDDI